MLREDFPEHGIDALIDPAAIQPGPPAPKDAVRAGGQNGKLQPQRKLVVSDKPAVPDKPVAQRSLADILHKKTVQKPVIEQGVVSSPKQVIIDLLDFCEESMPYRVYTSSSAIQNAKRWLEHD